MQSNAKTVEDYLAGLPEDRRRAMLAIREVINKNLPEGFKEAMGYGNMGWVVPKETYPPGYHCNPEHPLPYIGLASQKNNISLYSMCLYGSESDLDWFKKEWPKHTSRKLDMGKSCIRFKKLDDIPLELIGKLASRMTPQQWIEKYESNLKR